MNKILSNLLLLFVFFAKTGKAQDQPAENRQLDLSGFKLLGEVDERFQSFNVEMCEVVGGDFWVPYHLLDPEKVKREGFAALKHQISPIDLYQKNYGRSLLLWGRHTFG